MKTDPIARSTRDKASSAVVSCKAICCTVLRDMSKILRVEEKRREGEKGDRMMGLLPPAAFKLKRVMGKTQTGLTTEL